LKLPAATILAACRGLGLRYEIYTRLEQLFDRRRSHQWNLRRALLLATEAPQLRRLFVGVESGSASQLRRYGKGQTLAQTVDALRVASHLGVPLEFGFITFDPLLTAAELGENLAFLARTDVICNPHDGEPVGAVAAVGHYLNGATLTASGEPIFAHVAYMATELEILARSRYADHLHRKHPDLLDGTYDPGFARYGARYADPRVGEVAAWCRVWTEGMFAAVYEARMTARSAGPGGAVEAETLVRRYRQTTFGLIVALTADLLPEVPLPITDGPAVHAHDPLPLLEELAIAVVASATRSAFDPGFLERHRDR
jgi:hypothetical protein